ncbi:MAG TPA: sulfotransferase [Dongiaceae bacterium]|nr:sulfotransferase [Dongiaceae bacterium]
MSPRPPRPAASPAPSAADPGRLALVKAYCADAEKLLLEDRFHEARKVVQQALRLMPDYAAAVHILGVIEMESGNLEEAARLIKRTTELEPGAHDPFYFLGLTYFHLGRPAEAAEAFAAALALKPDLRAVLREQANVLSILGRNSEAVKTVRHWLSLEPDAYDALLQLARLDPGGVTEEETARLQAAAESSEVKLHGATACFALFSLYEWRGEDDKAFAYLKRGNDLQRDFLTQVDGKLPSQMVLPLGAVPRRMAPAKALDDLQRRTVQVEHLFSQSFLAQYAGFGHPSNLPIFIVGMPRSGSTLIEQILSSHPLVHGAGEIDAAENCLVRLHWPFEGYLQRGPDGAMRPSPPPKPPSRYFRERGADYVKALRGYSARAQRIIDKMPGNYLAIGMIHLCLPKATILHSVRDPVDTCLGCYKQIFATGNETTYDLAMLGRHYRLYRRVMEHWQRVLPGRVIDVTYERLVADPEGEIRRLLAACGLPWHEGCLRFYENQRPVRTASYNQVRQPIFKSAVQRWRRHERHLGPLLEALGPYAPKADSGG